MSESIGLFKPTRKELLAGIVEGLRKNMRAKYNECLSKEHAAKEESDKLKEQFYRTIKTKMASRIAKVKKEVADFYNRVSDEPRTEFEFHDRINIDNDGTATYSLTPVISHSGISLNVEMEKELFEKLKTAQKEESAARREREQLDMYHRNDVADYVSNLASPVARDLFEQLIDTLREEYVGSKKK